MPHETILQKPTITELEHKHHDDHDASHHDDQLLHLVFGGELEELDLARFRDPDKLDIVGIFPNFKSAHAAWKSKAQATVDNALMRYFIVHLHRFLDPRGLARPHNHDD